MYINYKLQLCSLRTYRTTKGEINTPCVHSHILPRVIKEKVHPHEAALDIPLRRNVIKKPLLIFIPLR